MRDEMADEVYDHAAHEADRLRLCPSCGCRWKLQFFSWWSKRCRACRRLGPAEARRIRRVIALVTLEPFGAERATEGHAP